MVTICTNCFNKQQNYNCYLWVLHDSQCKHGLRISLNSVKKLIFLMVKCGVLFEVRTEILNII
jgi:hypothetical protein